MRHSTCLAVFTAPNCFRTVIRNTGISRLYSVCVKDIYNLEDISRISARSSSRELNYTCSFTRVWSVCDRDLFYYQRPYKNVKYKEFKRRGRYLMIECFTTYNSMHNIDEVISNDKYNIKDLLFHLLEEFHK